MLRCHRRQSYFPTAGTSTDGGPEQAPASGSRAYTGDCAACRSHLRHDDIRHTRISGDCRAALTAPREWNCPGCKAGARRLDSRHSLDPADCKWAAASSRNTGPQQQRTATERPPRQPVRDEPTAEAVGPDVGQAEQDRPAVPPPEAAPAPPPAAAPEPAAAAAEPEGDGAAAAVPDPPPPADGAARPRRRGPDRQPRAPLGPRPGHADAAVGESPIVDWTAFDVTGCLRALRVGTEAEVRRVLRRLHLRWWHARSSSMHKILNAAGVPATSLAMIH